MRGSVDRSSRDTAAACRRARRTVSGSSPAVFRTFAAGIHLLRHRLPHRIGRRPRFDPARPGTYMFRLAFENGCGPASDAPQQFRSRAAIAACKASRPFSGCLISEYSARAVSTCSAVRHDGPSASLHCSTPGSKRHAGGFSMMPSLTPSFEIARRHHRRVYSRIFFRRNVTAGRAMHDPDAARARAACTRERISGGAPATIASKSFGYIGRERQTRLPPVEHPFHTARPSPGCRNTRPRSTLALTAISCSDRCA